MQVQLVNLDAYLMFLTIFAPYKLPRSNLMSSKGANLTASLIKLHTYFYACPLLITNVRYGPFPLFN